MSNIYTTGSNTQPNYSITGAGVAGYGTTGYSNVTLSTSAGYNGSWSNNLNPALTIKENPTTLEVKGTLVVNGKNLEERLDVIEKVLNIPERDVTLEEKYPKLKKMYDEYIKELSKARMWESLKGESE